MVYFITEYYLPNSAEYNRLLSFLKCFKEDNVDVKVVYIVVPNKLQGFPKDYLILNNNKDGGSILGKLVSIIKTIIFINSLKDGDSVIFLTTTWCMILPLLNKNKWAKKNIRFYHEQTEYPLVLRSDNYLNRFLFRLYFKACLKLDGLFVISESLKQFFIDKGLAESKICIVNITVDPTRFDFLVKNKQSNYIAYCGTVSKQKDGVVDLLISFSVVSKIYPDIHLYIIGKYGNIDDEVAVKSIIREMGLEKNVILTGMIPYTEMPKMLFNAKALLLSRPDNIQAKYGFPTKLGEYLLTGNPVVVTKVGDIPHFLKNGINAFVVEPGNHNEFANSIIDILKDPIKAMHIGEAGKQVALECFNYQTEARKIISIVMSYSN